MNFRLLSTLCAGSLASVSLCAFAGPSQFSGPLNTLGNVSTNQTILSATINPAAGELVVEKRYRWGYMSTAGFGFEIGQVDELQDSVDDLTEELDRLDEKASGIGNGFVTLGEVEAVKNQFDDVLVELGQKGAINLALQARAPLFPIAIRSERLKGVVTLDAYASVDIGALFIDSPLNVTGPTLEGYALDTDTAVDLTMGQVSAFSLGYSHDFANPLKGEGDAVPNLWGVKLDGRLLLGAELNLYQVNMSSQVIAIDQEDSNEELSDVIADEFDQNQVTSSDFGLDLGLLWVAKNYQLGMTWKNINEPEFKSAELGVNCNVVDTAIGERNCEVAAMFGVEGRLDLTPSYIMESQMSVEAALTTENKHWNFAGSYDLNEISGAVKDNYQWLTASASYFSDSLWIPMARVGYRVNRVGSELSFVSAGITAFGGTHIDLSMALDVVTIDGEELPRAAAVNIGFERHF